MYAFKKKTLKVIHVRLTLSYNRTDECEEHGTILAILLKS